LGCSGCIQNSSAGAVEAVGADPKVFGEGQLFPGEVAGGTAAHGSGGVWRNAGHGGNGQCSAVRVLEKGRVQVLPTKGGAGRPGLVSIRGCRTWRNWSAVKKGGSGAGFSHQFHGI
jgi:hypothetical protein